MTQEHHGWHSQQDVENEKQVTRKRSDARASQNALLCRSKVTRKKYFPVIPYPFPFIEGIV
jgi:hypothetical protein